MQKTRHPVLQVLRASRIGDLKMYVMLNELLPKRGPNIYKKCSRIKNYIHFVFFCIYFLIPMSTENKIIINFEYSMTFI